MFYHKNGDSFVFAEEATEYAGHTIVDIGLLNRRFVETYSDFLTVHQIIRDKKRES